MLARSECWSGICLGIEERREEMYEKFDTGTDSDQALLFRFVRTRRRGVKLARSVCICQGSVQLWQVNKCSDSEGILLE